MPSKVIVADFTTSAGGGGASVHMIENGTTTVVFVDRNGNMTLGHFFNSTQATADLWPGDTATLSPDGSTITWSDGTVWTQSAPSSQLTVNDYVTDYPLYAGVGVHTITNGTQQIAWVDGRESIFSPGSVSQCDSSATSDMYPGDVATLAAGNIVWQDGTIWTRSATPQVLVSANVNGDVVLRLLAVNRDEH